MCLFFLNGLLSQTYILTTQYLYKNYKIKQKFRVVQLTDLHNYQFGPKNQRLIKKIVKEEPDVIFLTGDMLNANEEQTDILTELIEQLVLIAPVYASLGNHEEEYMQIAGNRELITQMEQAGAVVLDKQYLDIEIGDQEVRLGGIYGYVLAEEWQDGSEQRFMEAFQDTDRFKILLSHMPEGLLLWKSMEHWDVDLVFSGHVHGGQVRLPFIGGLYDPEEGYFPTYTKGMFECGNGTMILSAGLGSSRGIPRVNNLPEMMVCEIEKE
ncbi:MAG: metallophosphoesterase [Marvinbryantia sp.]